MRKTLTFHNVTRSIVHNVARGIFRVTSLGTSKGAHVTRFYMYRHLAQFASRPAGGRVLSISHSESLCRLLGYTTEQITDASYPESNFLDLPFSDATFDAVVSDQVLEHVEGDPFRAIAESLRVLKPGGMAVHTTCLINPVHGAPGDYWRFTTDGLRLLVKGEASVLDAGGWGNVLVWPYGMLGLHYERVPEARWHPAYWVATLNQSAWHIATWIVVRKEHVSSAAAR